MTEIHTGAKSQHHGPGEPHHTYDREIDHKAIGKWMAGLLVTTVVVQLVTWWFLVGVKRFDARNDPKPLPIEVEVQKANGRQLPPEPRLQVTPAFEKLNPDAGARSDLEDMQILRGKEDQILGTPSWIDAREGRVRVPIDVAMEVIARRGEKAVAPPAVPAAQDQPAGAGPGPSDAAPPPASQEQ